MKYQKTQTQFKSNNNLETLSLGINDTKKAIELLYSQYQYPIRTMVQELICNAFDAMQDAGKEDEQISVELPHELNNNHFVVRDYGNSMNPDQIKNIYMRINASTKSDNNKAIGGFGIGSKTPWAYTESFILTTYVNGIERQYLMVRGRETISKVYEGETNEPNGTKVTVKCKQGDSYRFNEAYQRAILFAKTKPKFNNVEPVEIKEVFKVCDKVSIVEPNDFLNRGDIYVTIGGVLYLTHNISNRFRYKSNYDLSKITNKAMVISLPVGAMTPLQTREAIDVSKQENISMFKSIVKRALKFLKDYIEREQSNVVDIESAITYAKSNQWYKVLFTKEYGKIQVTESGVRFKEYGDRRFKCYTKNSKSYGHRKNLKVRSEFKSNLTWEKADHVYFNDDETKISPNRRFGKLLNNLNYITVLDKSLFSDLTLYETLKKIFKAQDVKTVELAPIVRTTSNYVRPKRAKNEVVFYTNFNHRKGIYNIDELERKHLILKKDERLSYSVRELVESLGYLVSKVAPSNYDKVLTSPMCYTYDQVKENVNVRRLYTINKERWNSNKITPKTHIYRNLCKHKKELFKDLDKKAIDVTTIEDFFGQKIELDNKLYKKLKKRRWRAEVIEKKLELIEKIPWQLDRTRQGDKLIKEYIDFKLGVR